jgi:nitroreductase
MFLTTINNILKEGSPMTVMEAIQQRRSIRSYTGQPVEEEKLIQVLEAARLAPSASNRQSWRFIAVRDPAVRAKLAEAAMSQPFVGTAPVILVACGTEPEGVMACGQHRYSIDLSIATAFMILEAWEQGLGTCWLGRFDEQQVKDALGIPAGVRVVAMTPLGYPAETPAARPRKSQGEVVGYDRFE